MTSGLSKMWFLRNNRVNWEMARKVTHLNSRALSSFKSSDLKITPAQPNELATKPPVEDLVFGKYFSDHMLRIQWTKDKGWEAPEISKLTHLKMHPGAKVLHYAQELFEGMKAYRGVDDNIRMFRPMHNMARMQVSAKRACLPDFDPNELIECIRRLVQIDQEWVPHCSSSSLYIRPTFIGTDPALGVSAATVAEIFVILSPVGPYFSSGVKPVNLMADPAFVRAWPGGSGFAKMGSNYAPTLWTSSIAAQNNCHQVLWLFGPDMEITEVGAMNIFASFKDKSSGKIKLITPSLDSGMILPGVTRRSVIELAKDWEDVEILEGKLTLTDVLDGAKDGSLLEMFGTGTAAIVSPVGNIFFEGKMRPLPVANDEGISKRILTTLSDIYYGKSQHSWAINIEDWAIDSNEQQRINDYKKALEDRVAVKMMQ